jgi:ribosome maturation protein SDO1
MRQTFDKEKVTHSIARLRHSGEVFEIVIDPENALKLRRGEVEVHDCLLAPHIYKSIQSGEVASPDHLMDLFKTSDEKKVAERIILEGELHFNDEYKEKVRGEKKSQIFAILTKEAAEMGSENPVSEKKLVSAFSQAKITIDLYKKVDEQIPEILVKLRQVLPLTLERKTVSLRIPSQHAARLYGLVSSRSRIVQEAWLGDGAFSAKVELPAGAVAGFLDELKKATHGDVEANVEAKKKEIGKK